MIKKNYNTLGAGLFAFFISGLFAAALVAGLGACWEYSIETIGLFFSKPVDFPYWAGCVLSFVPGIGQLSLPLAAIVFILTFFI